MVEKRLQGGVTVMSERVTSTRSTDAQQKAQLRAIVQEDVLAMTRLRRNTIWAQLTKEHPDWAQTDVQAEVDRLQPEYQEYDPVVAMAVMSANHEHPVEVRLRAAAESAQYLRPKLKSIEMTVDPRSAEEVAVRRELASRLVGLLDAASAAKRATIVEGVSRRASPGDDARDVSSPVPDEVESSSGG